MKQKLEDHEYLKQREKEIWERNEAKEREEKEKDSDEEYHSPSKKKKAPEKTENDIESIEYKYAKGFNRATQIFYSIEGLMEKAAYEENIGKFNKDDHEEGLCCFGLYKWLDGKP